MHSLAGVYKKYGKYEVAIGYFKELSQMLRAFPDHPAFTTVNDDLAETVQMLENSRDELYDLAAMKSVKMLVREYV